MVDEVDDFSEYEKRRHLMRPGITITWVIEGARDLPFSFWMEKDIDYIKSSSLNIYINLLFWILLVILGV